MKKIFDLKSNLQWRRYLAIPAVLVVLIALFGAVTSPEKVVQKTDGLQTKLAKNSKEADKKNKEALEKQKETSAAKTKQKKAKLTKQEKEIAKKYQLTDQEMKFAAVTPLTGVGDSVLEDTGADLQEIFPTAYMSSKVGRQVDEAPGIIAELKRQKTLSDNVLINLGANGPISDKDVKAVEDAVGSKRHIFWVNVHVPTKTWEGSVNKTLDKATKQYKNLTVIDWFTPSKNQPGWFYGDYVHPNPDGSKQYATIVAKKIIKTLNK